MASKTKKAAALGALALLFLMGAKKPSKKKKNGNGANGDGMDGGGHDPYDPEDEGFDPSGPPGPAPDDGSGGGDEIFPSPTPTQGGHYGIKKGDTFVGIARALFPEAGGAERIAIARVINEHPRNAGLLIVPKKEWNRKYIGDLMISFYPDWMANPRFESERFESGHSLATIYIPTFEEGMV